MDTERLVALDLARLGDSCARMGSSFLGTLLKLAAQGYSSDDTLRALLDRHAHLSSIGLRLAGAAHFRALRGVAPEIAAHYPSTGGDGDAQAGWNAVLADVHAHSAAYDPLLERPIQTNEVARAMPVLGAMLSLAHDRKMPLRVFEIGSSAGLLLNFDRYRYEGDRWSWGDSKSPVVLRNRIAQGRPPHLDAALSVVERRGCDLHPLDAANSEHADTLLGFIWPDQHERFTRLRAALEVARTYPIHIEQGDGVAWARYAAAPAGGAATVLLHTIVTEHMEQPARAALRDAIEDLAGRATPGAPFAWVRMELAESGYETRLTHWPGASESLIARSDGHAQNIEWLP
jgi:hypothetical protein